MDEISSSSIRVKELASLRAKILAKLEKVENDTADAEYQYLEETDHGNIVKGFEGYVTSIEIQLLAPLDSYTSGLVRRTGKLGRSSVTCPLPDEDDAPFATPPQAIEALMAALMGTKEMKATDMPVNPPDEKQITSNTVMKRRRNTVAGSEGTVTAPLTPSAIKAEEPQSVGPAKRATRRRRQ